MARPLRIEYPGAWYHVMNRGRRKEPVFISPSDYKMFTEVLDETVQMFGIEIHAFALIENHYHILIRTPLGNISRAMRHINGVYTQRINNKHKIDGSLFRGRYKSILVSEDEYLLELVRYIHRNPYKSGLEQRPGEYEWCSHRMYLNDKDREDWLTINTVLELFSSYEKEAKRRLRAFVNKEVPKELMKKLGNVKWPSILGGEEFKEKIGKYVKREKIKEREIPEYKVLKGEKYINDEDERFKQFMIKHKAVLQAKRSKRLGEKRRALVYILKEKTQKSNQEISTEIGNITDASISKMYRAAMEEIRKKEGCYKEMRKYMKELKF